MELFVFDMVGTLFQNPHLSFEEAERLLRQLRAEGAEIIIWTGSAFEEIPPRLKALAHSVWRKDGTMRVWDGRAGPATYVDDDALLRRAVERYVRRRVPKVALTPVAAEDIFRLIA
jgi:hydroxymethylpyrimidine pyrophosphatase-like HAD family hydrolase